MYLGWQYRSEILIIAKEARHFCALIIGFGNQNQYLGVGKSLSFPSPFCSESVLSDFTAKQWISPLLIWKSIIPGINSANDWQIPPRGLFS